MQRWVRQHWQKFALSGRGGLLLFIEGARRESETINTSEEINTSKGGGRSGKKKKKRKESKETQLQAESSRKDTLKNSIWIETSKFRVSQHFRVREM